jgi:hypothetical protein
MIDKMEFLKERIYKVFFEVQNKINAYLGRTIVMTYVHIDEFGRREIRVADNNAEQLEKMTRTRGTHKFNTLKYNFSKHYT